MFSTLVVWACWADTPCPLDDEDDHSVILRVCRRCAVGSFCLDRSSWSAFVLLPPAPDDDVELPGPEDGEDVSDLRVELLSDDVS